MSDIDYWRDFHEKLDAFIENIKAENRGKRHEINVTVSIGDIIGRDSQAQSLWDFLAKKISDLTACNIAKGAGRKLNASVTICLSGPNKSKVPASWISSRSTSYKGPHAESYVHRLGKEIFDNLMENIKEKTGKNGDYNAQLLIDISNRLDKQLPDTDKKNNEVNHSIVKSLKDHVIGITTNGSRDAFDQTFIDTLGVASYDGSTSMYKVAHALGGNRNTMRMNLRKSKIK